MIKVKLLNSEATLNDFFVIEALEFVPGENVTVAMQIFDSQKNIRFVPPLAATMSMTFTNKDGTSLVKSSTVISADDRSMRKVSLTQAESINVAGQNIVISLDVNGDGTVIQKTVAANVLVRKNLSGDC